MRERWPTFDGLNPVRKTGGRLRTTPDMTLGQIARGFCFSAHGRGFYGNKWCPTTAQTHAARIEWVRRFPDESPPWCR